MMEIALAAILFGMSSFALPFETMLKGVANWMTVSDHSTR
jgi:hypothetical protein